MTFWADVPLVDGPRWWWVGWLVGYWVELKSVVLGRMKAGLTVFAAELWPVECCSAVWKATIRLVCFAFAFLSTRFANMPEKRSKSKGSMSGLNKDLNSCDPKKVGGEGLCSVPNREPKTPMTKPTCRSGHPATRAAGGSVSSGGLPGRPGGKLPFLPPGPGEFARWGQVLARRADLQCCLFGLTDALADGAIPCGR